MADPYIAYIYYLHTYVSRYGALKNTLCPGMVYHGPESVHKNKSACNCCTVQRLSILASFGAFAGFHYLFCGVYCVW